MLYKTPFFLFRNKYHWFDYETEQKKARKSELFVVAQNNLVTLLDNFTFVLKIKRKILQKTLSEQRKKLSIWYCFYQTLHKFYQDQEL